MSDPIAKIDIFMQGGVKVELLASSEEEVNTLLNTIKTGVSKGGLFTITITPSEGVGVGAIDQVIHYFIASHIVHFSVMTLRTSLAPHQTLVV